MCKTRFLAHSDTNSVGGVLPGECSIGTRLASGQTVAGSGQRFSDTLLLGASGAFSKVGSAAGFVVSAPTAAIGTDARETYSARFHDLHGGMLGD